MIGAMAFSMTVYGGESETVDNAKSAETAADVGDVGEAPDYSIVSQGEDLVALANDAVTGLELSDQKNVDIARAAIDRFYNTSAG